MQLRMYINYKYAVPIVINCMVIVFNLAKSQSV